MSKQGKQKNNSKWYKVGIIILILAVMASIAIYFYMDKNKDKKQERPHQGCDSNS